MAKRGTRGRAGSQGEPSPDVKSAREVACDEIGVRLLNLDLVPEQEVPAGHSDERAVRDAPGHP